MIKAFENFEVWFVTGAQLLYGGDAVKQVDAHSKEMVEGLNTSGLLPVKVVYAGTANSSHEVADVMSRASHGCTLSHQPRCGLKACRYCTSLCYICTPNTTSRYHGKQWTWIS